ncbi:hypothetical protein [Christiangramia sediminis]|uniref:Uncharacterized protein n=1 Tax=Christiangramia sediminis TaxID=2881336 RepID=A0A9X1RWQ3_9FLAO|nr:hypothetical protein [Christiangramia sediminis]MCB7479825.1 hypothetical protein [Christiangramia sediminis]
MIKRISILSLILTLAISCDKDSPIKSETSINGNYSGLFQRGEQIGEVTLEFQKMEFSGQSKITKFPAICEGNYSIENDSINFTNTCPWTAEFDWTLILNGKWKYEVSKDQLILTKFNGDKYILTKK